ncbi:MAG: hypothetical protein HC915_12650 [Anaerolineae bacterium]|nr:hypothetical protein [Anaerolineae bacterium]
MTVLTKLQHADPREHVLCVSFMKVGKLHYFDFADFPHLMIGDHVIVETRQLGPQMGEVKGFRLRNELEGETVETLSRPATPADLLLNQQWKEKEVPALIDCREKAAQLGGYGPAKFVAAEYNYNGSVLTILFTADEKERLNVTRLRNVLAKQLKTHVEFRQIGPRDVAKVQEGFGACGIPRCCSTFLTDFSMISINMAKAQGISLNPAEITGMCGRLRCCLTYEYEQYVEARKRLPKLRKRVGTPHGEGRVIEVHALKDGVTVLVDEARHYIPREDLIPLEEWEALKAAAAAPCSKNESGGCDCGAKRPRGSAEETLAEMGMPKLPHVHHAPMRPAETANLRKKTVTGNAGGSGAGRGAKAAPKKGPQMLPHRRKTPHLSPAIALLRAQTKGRLITSVTVGGGGASAMAATVPARKINPPRMEEQTAKCWKI